jgi:hypothetical protein
MKLYNVRVEIDTVIGCESENDIEEVLIRCFSDIADDSKRNIHSVEVQRFSDLPVEWRESLPYGMGDFNEEELSCQQILERNADKKVVKELPAQQTFDFMEQC